MRILVVEDESKVASFIRQGIEEEGHAVEVAGDGAVALDLMSSWVSHLPEEVTYRRVVGLGMNAAEIAANALLNTRVVQELN